METDPNPPTLPQDPEWQISRPSIPRAIVAEILLEAGHRCAVCGEATPLERAHIIPWRKVREHKAENLVCLCANCHQRADSEKWGEKILKEYKRNPWVRRRYAAEEVPKRFARVELTIAMELSEFDEVQQRWLQHALASFLDVTPSAIKISSIEEGSVKVRVELPERHAKRLIRAYNQFDSKLQSRLDPLNLLGIEIIPRAPSKKTPAKKATAKKAPAKKAPAKKAPAKKVSAKKVPAKKAPAKKVVAAKKGLKISFARMSRPRTKDKIA